MPHRDAPLPAPAHGLLGDVEHVHVLGLVEEVDVEVHVDVELPREAKHDVDLGVGVRVVVGAAADQIGAVREGLLEQRLGSGRLEYAFLREGAELEVDGPRVLPLELGESLQALQSHDGIDLHVAAHGGGAGAHGLVQRAPRARADVVHGETPLGLGSYAECLRHRALDAGRPLREERLVEMDVRVHQPGREHEAAAVHRAVRGTARQRADLLDLAVERAEIRTHSISRSKREWSAGCLPGRLAPD